MKRIIIITLALIVSILAFSNLNVNARTKHPCHQNSVMGLKKAKNPRFKINSKVYLESKIRKYMKHSHARVVGAYNSSLYEVSYRPKGKHYVIKNYCWLVSKQISGHLKRGAKVRLKPNFNHMKSAYAKIISIRKGPAYIVNYRPTSGGYVIKNYKWLASFELKRR